MMTSTTAYPGMTVWLPAWADISNGRSPVDLGPCPLTGNDMGFELDCATVSPATRERMHKPALVRIMELRPYGLFAPETPGQPHLMDRARIAWLDGHMAVLPLAWMDPPTRQDMPEDAAQDDEGGATPLLAA